METQAPKPEMGEKEKYHPRYMIFLGRHAEPSKRSIFDQVGGEKGIRSDNFEESSLTLEGIMKASLLNYDLMSYVVSEMPEGKIRIVFGNTRAYRTRETAEIISQDLKNMATRLNREIDIEFEGPEEESYLTETRDEEPGRSVDDIAKLISTVKANGTEGNLVYFGITHDRKLTNFLNQMGIYTDNVNPAEFLKIVDEDQDRSRISFRDQIVELDANGETT